MDNELETLKARVESLEIAMEMVLNILFPEEEPDVDTLRDMPEEPQEV